VEEDEDYAAHVHAVINPDTNTPKRRVPKSAKTTKIGAVDIDRENMTWLKGAKISIERKFVSAMAKAGKAASAVQVSTGKIITKKKYGRRHIISFADMQEHYKKAFPPEMTVAAACERLSQLGVTAQFTKKSVHSKVRSFVRQAFNWPENVRIGPQAENSSLGREIDPTDDMLDRHGKRIQKAIDDHVKAFLGKWGVPGVPFGVTQKKSDVVEWEIVEE